jgi:hypothetical protein
MSAAKPAAAVRNVGPALYQGVEIIVSCENASDQLFSSAGLCAFLRTLGLRARPSLHRATGDDRGSQ